MDYLQKPIEYVKGVGPEKGTLLRKELDIHTVGDLLLHYPYRYIDRSKVFSIGDCSDTNSYIQIKGKIIDIRLLGEGRAKRLSATLSDHKDTIELIWFNGVKWIMEMLKINEEYIVFGKPSVFNSRFNITHPEIEHIQNFVQKDMQALQPMYNSTEKMKNKGLDSRGIRKIIYEALLRTHSSDIPEIFPIQILEHREMYSRYDALQIIHQPKDLVTLEKAQYRIKYEEFFLHQLRLIKLRINHKKSKGILLPNLGEKFNDFYTNHLPFVLTNAQKRVLKDIRKDTLAGIQMNRLLQGDVGSGKTIVAILTMLMAIDNGYQSALMAPTEILAQQHYQHVTELLAPLSIQIRLLTGSIKGKERKVMLEDLASGKINIIVGTHALLEDKVAFANLGMAVIDEQHRFGVAQRAKLRHKNAIPPHILVMTATPIPRSLAMVFYGDLDYSVIDELPPGRKPILTVHRTESSRLTLNGFLRDEISKGRQVYIVYPLIEESEKLDLANLMEGYESICRAFPRPQYQVSIVHGKMKSEDKDIEMDRFLKKETHIMVATTVIEVGVNIPNASVMVIENAERFGLSQLHQLRGRVGRGAEQSYCILMSGYKLSNEAKKRISTMCDTNDGFKIAETDLEIRGPGDIEGTRQSGVILLKLANLASDKQILEEARHDAINLLESDPHLINPHNFCLSVFLRQNKQEMDFWSTIL
jgi:ATP-dependent DNA helicase RecG